MWVVDCIYFIIEGYECVVCYVVDVFGLCGDGSWHELLLLVFVWVCCEVWCEDV